MSEINIIITLLNGDCIDVEIPLEATSIDIIEALLDAEIGVNRYDNFGQKIPFVLIPIGKPEPFPKEVTFGEMQVQNGDGFLLLNENIYSTR
jgi:hypothetical protein